MNNIMDAEFIDVPVEDAYYSTFVVNKYSSTPSIQDSAYSSPRPSPPWPSSESISDSCSGTWSSPTPSIAYSPSPKPTHYRNIYPTWSSQEGTHYSLQPFTSLNQVQFQADASTYTQGEAAGLPYYQDQYPHTHILDAQALSFAGLGDWTTVEYPRSSSEQILESSPAPSSTTAAIVISRHNSPERNVHPQIKQEEPEEHHHHTCLESSISKKHTAKATTAYPCPFLPYGCPATFSSKNEWKRHLNTQHLSLSTYRCDLCIPRPSSPSSSSPTQSNDFNRKDLFIQHLRRHKDIIVHPYQTRLPLSPSKHVAATYLLLLHRRPQAVCFAVAPSPVHKRGSNAPNTSPATWRSSVAMAKKYPQYKTGGEISS
ncbi:MAG: Hemerythrin HHE cation binding domain protein [Aureobasidium pullulans]|uniref:C2H2-type domain-containing protein n=1 Tax=Aureobasidium pullulans TaxID=5580 RepID=A0AB74IN77_AURPU|nr:MAG: Hemerythrin HHE cation binding domain protein [Aureobasidium pullulans]THW35667.1 hypothetical protein D6D21_09052 [Aureobasidium pullulans]TIA60372.1 hypothetical protein D6C77_04185 [Aureobasidium pullulans]